MWHFRGGFWNLLEYIMTSVKDFWNLFFFFFSPWSLGVARLHANKFHTKWAAWIYPAGTSGYRAGCHRKLSFLVLTWLVIVAGFAERETECSGLDSPHNAIIVWARRRSWCSGSFSCLWKPCPLFWAFKRRHSSVGNPARISGLNLVGSKDA